MEMRARITAVGSMMMLCKFWSGHTGSKDNADRDQATGVAALYCTATQYANILRVHNPRAVRQAMAMANALGK